MSAYSFPFVFWWLMAEPKNPWFRQYGVIGTIALALIISNVAVHVDLAMLRTDVATRLALIEQRIEDIPPPEQIAHNMQNDTEIAELKRELDHVQATMESRIARIIDRFHAVIPKLVETLDSVVETLESIAERHRAYPHYPGSP